MESKVPLWLSWKIPYTHDILATIAHDGYMKRLGINKLLLTASATLAVLKGSKINFSTSLRLARGTGGKDSKQSKAFENQ
ncbi:hypothetical protein BH24ACT22_BH24ACT22_20480 [soil metagenome]